MGVNTVPNASQPIADANGIITQPWMAFFTQLVARTFVGTIPTITSAGTIGAPTRGQVIKLTGSTTLQFITGGTAGQVLIILFQTAILVDALVGSPNGINVAGGATTFEPTATLSLVFDGLIWNETGRNNG